MVEHSPMDKKTLGLLAVGLVILLAASGIAAFYLLASGNSGAYSNAIRVACVGDSLTQSSAYTYDLWQMLGANAPFTIGNYTEYPNETSSGALSGNVSYAVGNFGAGGTMIALKSETPYMNTSMFQNALEFQPNIVVIMLGTNDAQPGAHQYNTSLVDDYKKLVYAFQTLASKPKIWVVLPPPIFDSQGGKTSPEYLEQTVIPLHQASGKRD